MGGAWDLGAAGVRTEEVILLKWFEMGLKHLGVFYL